MANKPNVVAAVIGAGIATAGLIRKARLNNASQQLREDQRTYDKAKDALDTYMATFSSSLAGQGPATAPPPGFNPFWASQLQQQATDAMEDVFASQRKVDNIQSEEPIVEMAAGAGIADMALSGVGGGDDASGGDASWVLPALGGAFAGYLAGESNNGNGNGRRDNPSA